MLFLQKMKAALRRRLLYINEKYKYTCPNAEVCPSCKKKVTFFY